MAKVGGPGHPRQATLDALIEAQDARSGGILAESYDPVQSYKNQIACEDAEAEVQKGIDAEMATREPMRIDARNLYASIANDPNFTMRTRRAVLAAVNQIETPNSCPLACDSKLQAAKAAVAANRKEIGKIVKDRHAKAQSGLNAVASYLN